MGCAASMPAASFRISRHILEEEEDETDCAANVYSSSCADGWNESRRSRDRQRASRSNHDRSSGKPRANKDPTKVSSNQNRTATATKPNDRPRRPQPWGLCTASACQTSAAAADAYKLRVLPSVLTVLEAGGSGGGGAGDAIMKTKKGERAAEKTRLSSATLQSRPSREKLTQATNSFTDNYNAPPPIHTIPPSTNNIPNHVLLDFSNDSDGDVQIFSNRQWLLLPEQQYDMNTLHPNQGPNLGSMYWTAASPLPDSRKNVSGGVGGAVGMATTGMLDSPEDKYRKNLHCPSLVLCESSPVVKLAPSRTRKSINTKMASTALSHPFPSLVSPSSTGTTPSRRSSQSTSGIKLGIQEKLLYPNASTHSVCSSTSSSTPDLQGDSHLNYTNDSTCIDDSSSNNNNTNNDSDLIVSAISSTTPNEEDNGMNSPKHSGVDMSTDLLDYSALDESYALRTSLDMAREREVHTPRRLFDEEESEKGGVVAVVTPGKGDRSGESSKGECGVESAVVAQHDNGLKELFSCRYPSRRKALDSPSPINQKNKHFNSLTANPRLSPTKSDRSNPNISPNKPLPPSPSVATFYGHWGSRRERHISTLPSETAGKPIRLRVTETQGNSSGGINGSPYDVDFYSYDPYFSSGRYLITKSDGRPYGNGLVVKMGSQFMTLEDCHSNVLAVIKSRHTHTPSIVVYAPKPRFAGQAPSGHRLSVENSAMGVTIDGNECEGSSSELYPWALIQKEGRTMGDACTVHLVDEAGVGSMNGNGVGNRGRGRSSTVTGASSGMFNTRPTFRGKHGFDCELHTHTVVSRTISSEEALANDTDVVASKKSKKKEKQQPQSTEVPCCVIVRDPSDIDAVDITIAPGIDPLLMICYLASHSKMDVEPIMAGGF
eukprot:scaffold13326_cov204-Alexandrium_tamarense.AAC.43